MDSSMTGYAARVALGARRLLLAVTAAAADCGSGGRHAAGAQRVRGGQEGQGPGEGQVRAGRRSQLKRQRDDLDRMKDDYDKKALVLKEEERRNLEKDFESRSRSTSSAGTRTSSAT